MQSEDILPNEIWDSIFMMLPPTQVGPLSRVCRRWNEIISEPFWWMRQYEIHFGASECVFAENNWQYFFNEPPTWKQLFRRYHCAYKDNFGIAPCQDEFSFQTHTGASYLEQVM
jgi:hypothetical protein